MAIVTMAYAVATNIASASEYNKVVDNIKDLDARLGSVDSANNANARLGVLESRTTNAGASGIGNQALSDRLGSGVGNTTNVLTGTATAQLNDIRTRLSAVESLSGTGAPTVLSAPGSRGSVTSTAYVASRTINAGTGECGLVFTAPPSGKVKVFFATGIQAPNTTGFALATFQIRDGGTIGSGTVFPAAAASDNRVCQNTGVVGELSFSNFEQVEGLTPGAQYNAQMLYRTSTGTAQFNRPKIMVDPILA